MKKTHQSGTKPKEVKFKYERPRIFCYYCGKFGHIEDYCELLFSQTSNDGVQAWGPSIHVEARGGIS